jgi:ribosomal protein L7/L12
MSGVYSQQSLEAKFNAIDSRLAAIEAVLVQVTEKLGIPFAPASSVVPPDVVALARAGKKLDAVKRYREITGSNFDDARAVVDRL